MRIIHKALGISLLVHLAIVVFLAILPFIVVKKNYTPVYQVSLVTQPEPTPKEPQVVPEKKKPVVEQPVEVKEKTPPVTRKKEKEKKPEVKPKREEEKRKAEVRPKKETQSEQSLARVQRAIDEIKEKMVAQQKTQQEQIKTSRILEAKRNAYFDVIAAHIQANWSLLKNQMEDVGFLTTDLGLQIRRDGTISKIVIEKPSGNALFDEFAVRAVKRSTPLPPFPEELKESKLEVTIGLSS